jgi:hypothetical protein
LSRNPDAIELARADFREAIEALRDPLARSVEDAEHCRGDGSPKVKRGRFARILANGYIVEITPSEKATKKPERPPAPPPATNGR